MSNFKRIKDRKIDLKAGPGPYAYKKNWKGESVAKWKDFSTRVFSANDAKNRVTKQTWAYQYNPNTSNADYFTVNKNGYIPDGATIVYEKGTDLYLLEKTLEKCTTGPLSGESMVITCNNTQKFFSDEKINKARQEYAELKKAREDIKQFSIELDGKINKAYDERSEINERLIKLQKKLNDDLKKYNEYYDIHSKSKGNDTTLKAMEEDVKLKDGSSEGYYYVWLTLAISGMIAVSIMARN